MDSERTRQQRLGMILEYTGYLVLIIALFNISLTIGLVGLGAVIAYKGVRLRAR